MLIFSRYENHRFYAGMHMGEIIVHNYRAELDDEKASRLVLDHPDYFRVKAWPKTMLVSTGPLGGDPSVPAPAASEAPAAEETSPVSPADAGAGDAEAGGN